MTKPGAGPSTGIEPRIYLTASDSVSVILLTMRLVLNSSKGTTVQRIYKYLYFDNLNIILIATLILIVILNLNPNADPYLNKRRRKVTISHSIYTVSVRNCFKPSL